MTETIGQRAVREHEAYYGHIYCGRLLAMNIDAAIAEAQLVMEARREKLRAEIEQVREKEEERP